MQISGCILVFVLSVIVCCAQDHIDLDYKYGTEYQYEYRVGVVADEKSTRQFEPSKVNYTCQFSIKVFNGTGFLNITKVDVEDNFRAIDLDPESNDFTNYYLKFDMLPDGKVSSLYPDSRETNWVLNFKRGLLSMFTFDEEDVHGKCPTRVSVTKHEDGDFWKKYKNTSDCEQTLQPNSKLAVWSTMFEFKRYIEYSADNWYYEKKKYRERGHQECEGLVSDKIFQSINCTQKFIFNIGAGSIAFVDQELTLLTSDTESTATSFEDFSNSLNFKPVSDPKSLMYEAEDLLSPLNSNHYFEVSKSHLSEICKDDFERSSIDFIQKYIELVQAFSALSYEQLEALEKSSTCEFSKKMFFKTLLYTRSYSSMLLIIDKLIKKEVPDNIEEQWLEQLSLEEYINKPILDKAYELLQKRVESTSFALAAASIANTYCRKYETTCKEDTRKFQSEFEAALKFVYEHYEDNPNSVDNLFITIKLVKTLAYSNESDVEILKTILEDQKVKPFVRALVLDVYPNASNFKTVILEKIFEDTKQPIELRIAVYMKLYDRLQGNFIPSIYKVLKEESPNQVSNYIWSHLRYKMENKYTSNEEMAEYVKCLYTNCTVFADSATNYSMTNLINELFVDPELKVLNESEITEFSNYFEGDLSYQMKASGNMLFTPASFLPSHVETKFTPRRYNKNNLEVFKIFADIEGFDDYFMSIFELEGRSISKKLEEQKIRKRRSAKKEFVDKARVSIGSEIFGKHHMYEVFHGDRELKELLSKFNTLDKINVTMNGPDSNYNEASVIVDHVESFPTAAGFPVRYNLKAAFMRNLTIIGKVESENFRKSRELHFDGLFEQFYGAGISRHLSIDTYLTESTTKIEGFAMVKPKFHAKLDVEGFRHIHLDIGLVEDEDMHIAHLRVEHYPGSRYNKTIREKKPELECRHEIKRNVNMEICVPKHFLKDLSKNEYIDVPVTLKKGHVKDSNPNVTIHWDNIEDGKYVLNATCQYANWSAVNHVNFHTEDGELSIKVQDEKKKHEEVLFIGKYENSDSKYIKFSVNEKLLQTLFYLYKGSPVGFVVSSIF